MSTPVNFRFYFSARFYQLGWLALLSLAGYILFSLQFPLFPAYNWAPTADIFAFTPSLAEGLTYATWLIVMFLITWLAYRRLRQMAAAASLKFVLLTAALFCLPLLLAFPINANDIYRYFIRGRISAVHEANPFTDPPDAFPDDPYLPLAGEWAGATTPYGPVWEAIAAAVAGLTSSNLAAALLIFKILGALSHLGVTALIWLAAGHLPPGERAGRALLWAWNPALLLIFVVDAHNDGLMLLWLLLGWNVLRRGRPSLGLVLMVLAPLTKLIALLPLPLFFLTVWNEQTSLRARLRILLLSTGGGLLLAGLAFAPFGSPLALFTRLLDEALSDGGFSILTLIVLLTQKSGYSGSLGALIDNLTRSATLIFAFVTLLLAWLTWRGRSSLRATAEIFIAYLLQAYKFRLWYAAWPFAWFLLEKPPSSPRLAAGYTFLLTSQLSVVVYGHLWRTWLEKDHWKSHLIGVPLTFFVPVLLGLLVYVRREHSHGRQKEG